MRYFATFLFVLSISGCVNSRISYSEAKILAEADGIALQEKYKGATSESSSTTLDKVSEHCDFQKENFTVVLEIDKNGVIQDSWTDKDSEVMQCVRNNFIGLKFFEPQNPAFHYAIEWRGGPDLFGHRIVFTENTSCNPTIRASGILSENKGFINLKEISMELSNNPSFNSREIYIKNIRLRINAPTEDESVKIECPYGMSHPGWDCGHEGERYIVNRKIGAGEKLSFSNLELRINISEFNLNRKEWASVSIEVETENTLSTTGGEIGFF